MQKEEWYETWFDTPHYHILYKNRNYLEAEKFISNLLNYLKLSKGDHCLDLACGKGRHSIFLNKNDLNVKGVDLSRQSIAVAKPFENDTLSFDVHDMREVYGEQKFDVIFNLFTSFGYFENRKDNNKVLHSAYKMLTHNGRLVIDFMNVDYVLDHFVEKEVKTIQGIEFHISKQYNGTHIIKDIEFSDEGETYNFQEKVQTIRKKEFVELLTSAGFKVIDVFGDMYLNPFDKKNSDRLILIAQKK